MTGIPANLLFSERRGMTQPTDKNRDLAATPQVPWRALAMVVLAAACLRAARCLVAEPVTKDTVVYVAIARHWAESGATGAFDRNPRLPPLFPGLLAAGERLGLGAEPTGLALAVLAGALLPAALFLLVRALGGSTRLGLLTAILGAVHPMLLRNGAEVMRDSLFLLWFVSALALAAWGTTRTGPRAAGCWALAGLVGALGTMTRDEGGELLAIMVAWVAVQSWRGAGPWLERTRRAVTLATLLFATYFLTLCPVRLALADTGSSWRPVPERLASCWRTVQRRLPGINGTGDQP